MHDTHDTDDLTRSFALLTETRTSRSATYRATRHAFLMAAEEAIAELPPVPLPPRSWTLDGSNSNALFLQLPAVRVEVIPAEFMLDIRDSTVRIRTITGSSHLIALYDALIARLDTRLERIGD